MSGIGSNGTHPERTGRATAIVGLAFSLIGLFLINPFTIAGIAGVVFSIWGIVRSRNVEGTSRTITRVLAIIGIVLGALAILGWVLGLFVRQ